MSMLAESSVLFKGSVPCPSVSPTGACSTLAKGRVMELRRPHPLNPATHLEIPATFQETDSLHRHARLTCRSIGQRGDTLFFATGAFEVAR